MGLGLDLDTLDLAITAAGLAISGLATVPAIFALASRRGATLKDGIYCDKDGEATPESVAAFSTKWQRSIIVLWAGLGVAGQIALAVIAETSREAKFSLGNWLTAAAWVSFGRNLPIVADTIADNGASRASLAFRQLQLPRSGTRSAHTTKACISRSQAWPLAAGCCTSSRRPHRPIRARPSESCTSGRAQPRLLSPSPASKSHAGLNCFTMVLRSTACSPSAPGTG